MSDIPVVAIVDDDEAVREALSELLEVEGLSGRTFESAADFLAEYAPNRFNALITDVKMPGIDGIELQQRLRALGSSLPVIFITASSDRNAQARAQEGGAVAYLRKPVPDGVLLRCLDAALGAGRITQEPPQEAPGN